MWGFMYEGEDGRWKGPKGVDDDEIRDCRPPVLEIDWAPMNDAPTTAPRGYSKTTAYRQGVTP